MSQVIRNKKNGSHKQGSSKQRARTHKHELYNNRYMQRDVAPDLKHHLDAFLESFPLERHVSSDPVQFVHRYEDPRDQEVAGMIVSAFAYGNVKSILKTADRALSYLGQRPSQ